MVAPARTPAEPVAVRGVGLFTGHPATATIDPAPPGAGVAFVRVDLPGRPVIPATIDRVVRDPARLGLPIPAPARCTILAAADPRAFVVTVEHVMSALAGLGVTDARIEIDGPELPAGDGSALPFTDALQAVGIRPNGPGADPIVVTRAIAVEDGRGGRIEATPADDTMMRYELDYGPAAPLAPHAAEWRPRGGEYAREVAPARTFCLDREARAMRAAGLLAHLAPSDMLVIGPDGPIDNAYRCADEPARHKLLDLIGDLALVGRPIQGRIVAARSGHALNHELARALAALAPISA